MKYNILITGKGSYIGSQLINYFSNYDCYLVNELDMKSEDWMKFDFSNYQVVIHVAGIAHKNEISIQKEEYMNVNCNLAVRVANHAKDFGVNQFIFMSSMSVYGLNSYEGVITTKTECMPKTKYGISKFCAEEKILQLGSHDFKVVILRPPMVYGKECPGNMSKLLNLVKKIHVFPNYANERSYIDIDTLCSYIKDVITKQKSGIFLPQNNNYLSTCEFIKTETDKCGKKVFFIKIFNPIISFLIGKNRLISKMFGDLKYEK